jgi:hypothetical protein
MAFFAVLEMLWWEQGEIGARKTRVERCIIFLRFLRQFSVLEQNLGLNSWIPILIRGL